MLSLMSVARKISSNRQTSPVRGDDFDADRATRGLDIDDRYRSTDRQIKAGCDLFRAGEKGDAIYSLISGWVALYSLMEDGRRQILQFALPGAVLAFMPTQGSVMNYSAQALTDATVGIIPHSNLGRLAMSNPEIGIQLAGLISQDRSFAYDHLSSMGRRSARERVAYLLLELFIRCRLRWPGHRSEEMYLPLTQEHIGDATGLTHIHVNRVLRNLRKEGVAEFHYRRLRILNPDRLVDVAGIDPRVAMAWIDSDLLNEENAQRFLY
ncbi:Crp/Fnr family transcriptional regulator [Bradyrhizobium sp. G127]|uniref:Crp/Fnr family transcriptional regulator n=1 Tax=Bradyrhizobium sp. G127 TaxID=2904800 RepID=UPI001F367D95|nr:Crp/Fnr family transcriptional regulator [Bradyrhizobium sp. G127]MCF2521724.1 Crp/Fnr family transcriptional regulator [Bradyrhizobium sp. G127]